MFFRLLEQFWEHLVPPCTHSFLGGGLGFRSRQAGTSGAKDRSTPSSSPSSHFPYSRSSEKESRHGANPTNQPSLVFCVHACSIKSAGSVGRARNGVKAESRRKRRRRKTGLRRRLVIDLGNVIPNSFSQKSLFSLLPFPLQGHPYIVVLTLLLSSTTLQYYLDWQMRKTPIWRLGLCKDWKRERKRRSHLSRSLDDRERVRKRKRKIDDKQEENKD